MDTINEIRSFRNEYFFLSNFYPCKIVHDGAQYDNLEAAFQAAKCSDDTERLWFQCLEAVEAKKLGKRVKLRKDWERVKLLILNELIGLKFINNPELMVKLIVTGNAYLSEDNNWHDNFYGNCTCPRCVDKPGYNYLGYALMRLRNQSLYTVNYFNTGSLINR